jgi:hypothetical protein
MIYFQRYFQNQEFGKFGLSYSNEVLLERLLVPTRVSLKIKKAQIFSKFVQGFKGWVFVGLDRIQRIEDRVEDRIGTYVVYLCLTIFWQIIIAVK